jgi:transposase
MICVETIAKVRRDHFVHGKGIKRIGRERGLSRNSVRKILRSGETAFSYERPVQPLPKLGAFVERLEAMLEANEKRSKRDRLRMTRIFDDLRREGYEGGYDSVRRYARRWRETRTSGVANAFVPLVFAPGEAYQFDWSHEFAVLGGVTVKIKVAHFRLCHSRMRFLAAYPRETQEMVFDAHDQAFAFFGGGCTRGIYDNMSTAVDAVLVGKERRFNRRFERMCSHHLVEPTACSPAAGWEKGQVENQVQTSRNAFFKPRLHAADYDELNAMLRERVIAHAKSARHPEFKDRTIWEVFQEEQAALVALQVPFQGFHEVTAAVSKTCLVSFDRNRYSVSAKAVGRPVQLRAYATRLVILQDGEVVGEHDRVFGRDRTVYDPWHYVPVLERKPGAIRNGAPFRDMALPPAMAKLQGRLARLPDGDRQVVALLVAAHENGLDAVEAACRKALDEGLRSADAVLNILSRRREGIVSAPIIAPTHLQLRQEPIADCARYDRLIAEARRGAA